MASCSVINVYIILNTRKRLIRYNRVYNTNVNTPAVKILNKEIGTHFWILKIGYVKRAAMGNNGNIWKAVKFAKNLNVESLPKNLNLGGKPIAKNYITNCFANYFNLKVISNVEKTKVNPSVYNGKCRLIVQNQHFTTKNDVNECIETLIMSE